MKAIFSNNNRITFGSFLAYFLMSAIISPLGLVSAPIATHFDTSVTAATATFSFLTTGILAGTLIAVFIFDFARLKNVVVGGVLIICLSIYSIYAFDHFSIFTLCLALIGACCGVELSAAAIVIARLYEERLRASMLLLTDSFYSMAGVISTSLAAMLLARAFHWSSAYLLAFVVAFGMILIAIFSKYPSSNRDEGGLRESPDKRVWPITVHLVGLAMLIYMVGMVTIYSWIPNYAQAALGASVEASGVAVSRMFLGMFIGQLVMMALVFRFALRKLIVIGAVMATLLTVSLWTVNTALQLQLAMLVLGLVAGGLFKTVLTFGTTMVRDPSAKLVSYLIFHAGLGTAIAPLLSAMIVEYGGIIAALQFSTLCYALTFVMIIAARLRSGGGAAGRHDIPKTDFDQNTAEFAADPWSKYEELRNSCPVAHTDAHGGFWVLSRYEDVVKVAKDDITYSSVPTVVIPDSGVYNLIPLQSNPPDLQRYRVALLPFFTPKAIDQYAPRIRKFTTDCIDAFIDRGQCELVTELANPVPSMTALEFIGFDPNDWRSFAGPMHRMSYATDGSAERNQALEELKEIDKRIERAVAERRLQPRDDAISHLVAYEADGRHFTDLELHGLVKMLLFGGLDTTMAATSNALLYLSEHHDQRQRLIDEPSLIPGAVNEFLRFEAPVHAFARMVTSDTQIGGQKIRAGEKVYMLWASANRDPEQFENPDEVNFDRRPNRHLTFGIGGHRCLGALLARVELQVILEEVLQRIPDFKIDLDRVRHPTSVTIIWGRTSLPATFTPVPVS